MKKTYEVRLYTTVEVEVSDEKIEGTVKDFNDLISGGGSTIDDIMKHIAWNEARFGGFCEGVGENGEDFSARIICENSEVEEE